MTDVFLVAHGRLAYEMKKSAEMIFGDLLSFYPFEFSEEDGFDSLKEKISNVLNQTNESVLFLADLYAGTPFNVCCGLALEHQERDIEVLSGMSLPIILETATMRSNHTSKEIADYLLSIRLDMVQPFVIEKEEEEDEL